MHCNVRPAMAVVCLLLLCMSHVCAQTISSVSLRTADAPKATFKKHVEFGQNVKVDQHVFLHTKSDVLLYGLTSILRDDADPLNTPPVFAVSMKTGKVIEYFTSGKIIKQKATATKAIDFADDSFGDLDGMAAKNDEPWLDGWIWGTPTWINAGADGKAYLGSTENLVIEHDPAIGGFRKLLSIKNQKPIAATAAANGVVVVLTESGELHRKDDFGFDLVGKTRKLAATRAQLCVADNIAYIIRDDADGKSILSVSLKSDELLPKQLLDEIDIADGWIHSSKSTTWIDVKAPSEAALQSFRLQEGRTSKLDQPPMAVRVDFDAEPEIVVDGKAIDVHFSKAAVDKGKSISIGPHGKSIVGAGWPTAHIWQYDLATERYRRHGRDYVWYEQIPHGDEMYAIGYYGIKLMRWRPDQPWTFNYETGYNTKPPWPYKLHESPWGVKTSNPRLVVKFRYFNNLNIRRPSGFARGSDGRFYCGTKNAAHMFYSDSAHWHMGGTRYAGALCWYDPKTETIGSHREPFMHYEATDTCSVGENLIAVATKRSTQPFDPIEANAPAGKLMLFDTNKQQFTEPISPTDGGLYYVEEGKAGDIVGVAHPGKYAGDDVRSVLFVIDAKQQKVTKIIKLNVKIIWNVYDASDRFERGPNGCIYFYGTDENGTALFQFDSEAGSVKPIVIDEEVTHFATYINPGAPFCFGADRVWFSTTGLRSLPVDVVTGGAN